VQALAGEKREKSLGERDRESKLHTTSSTALAGEQSGECFSRAFEKTRQDKARVLRASEDSRF
jgi:hypothetical protein